MRKRVRMCISAEFIRYMWQILFIPAQQIKGRSKNIKWKIATGFKKNFVVIKFKTFDRLFIDSFFEKQTSTFNKKLLLGKFLGGIIQFWKLITNKFIFV